MCGFAGRATKPRGGSRGTTIALSLLMYHFSHPEARYFAVDLITKDQVENYARRKNMPIAEIERWLAPNLAYEVE